jgi:hypothetical protein
MVLIGPVTRMSSVVPITPVTRMPSIASSVWLQPIRFHILSASAFTYPVNQRLPIGIVVIQTKNIKVEPRPFLSPTRTLLPVGTGICAWVPPSQRIIQFCLSQKYLLTYLPTYLLT